MAEKEIFESEYIKNVKALTKELMQLTEAQREKAKTGLIIIAVNQEENANNEEVILSATGRRRQLVTGLVRFADKDRDLSELFKSAVSLIAAKAICRCSLDELLNDDEADKLVNSRRAKTLRKKQRRNSYGC